MLALAHSSSLFQAPAFVATVSTAVDLQQLIGAGQVLRQGLNDGQTLAEIGSTVQPFVANMQFGEGYEGERALLADLVGGQRFRRRDLGVVANGLLALRATGLPELSADEALAQFQQMTNPSLALLRGVWRPRTERIEAGKRDVTILFTDLKGFTKASERLEPDAIQEVLDQFISGMKQAVHARGGTVVKTIGDAVMAVFGAPVAHEDDADRAAFAALDMLRVVERTNARLRRRSLPNFEVRIGINAGTVWAGEIEIAPDDFRLDLIGAEVNRASRAETQAEPGSILITEPVRQRFRNRYQLEERGNLEGKDGRTNEIAEEIPVFRLQRVKSTAAAIRARGKEQVPFVGREAELAQLGDVFERVIGEQKPRLAVLSAEAGQGKSRLGAEFFADLESQGKNFTAYTAPGFDLAAKPPYAAITSAIRKRAGIEADDDMATQRFKLDYLVQLVFGSTEAERTIQTQLLGNLLGIRFNNPDPELEYLLQNPVALRKRTLEILADFFEHETEREPVILVLEDLHWTDTGTLFFVQDLLKKLQERPLFVLGLTRPHFLESDPHLLRGNYPIDRIDLSEFDEAMLSQMVDEIAGEKADQAVTAVNRPATEYFQVERGMEPPIVRDFLVTQSAGSPFLIQEMARSIRDGWQIERNPGSAHWRFVVPRARQTDGRQTVPVGPKAFLQARVDAFSRPERAVLKRAAVIGSEFTRTDLEGMRMADLDSLLSTLVQRKAIIELGNDRYAFPHALMRDTIYERIEARERRGLHQRRARSLETQDADRVAIRPDELRAQIASHYERGQDPTNEYHAGLREQAAGYYMEAAQDAYNRGANITASRFYERAAELSAEPERRVRALLGCDEALYSDKRHDKQMEVMERAEAIIETEEVEKLLQAEVRNQYGRALRLTREGELAERQFLKGLDLFAANENYSVKARLLMGLGSNETDNKRDFKKAYEHNMEAVEVSRNAGDKKTQLMALSNIVHIGLHTGEYSLSIEKSREALSVYDDKDPRVLRNKLILDNNFGSAFMNIGDYEEAIRIFRESIEISTKRAGGFYIDYLLPNLARALSLASSDEALARLDEAIATHSDHPDEFMAGVAHLYTALAYTERRDWERAAPEAEEALRVALVHQDEKLEAMAQMAVAQVFHGEGKNEEALKRNERAYELLEKFGMQIEEFDLEIMLTQAQILMDLDRMTEAWTVIDAARQILHERATKITDTTQSDSFLKNVRVNREIEKYWNLLRSVSTEGRDAHLARLIAGLNLRVPAELPPALAMIGPSRAHEVSAPVQLNGDTGSGTLLNIPIVDALKTLLSRKVTVPKNIGPIDQVWAEEIEWTPFFDEEGNPNASVEFKLKTSPGHQWVFRLIGQIAGFPNEYRIRLQGKVKEEGGIVSIEMNVQEDQMLTEQQFGRITFVLAPTPDGKTLLALKLRNRLFTSNPDVILQAFVEGLAG